VGGRDNLLPGGVKKEENKKGGRGTQRKRKGGAVRGYPLRLTGKTKEVKTNLTKTIGKLKEKKGGKRGKENRGTTKDQEHSLFTLLNVTQTESLMGGGVGGGTGGVCPINKVD